ncbi:hypothetical protein [Providencia manganoxydans]|uniref:hypothetical protein n=1 Tax=Providencia manganoxydans TaxID=2923283 RepID=UPI0034E455F0
MITPNAEIMDFSKVQELETSLKELSSEFSMQYDSLDSAIIRLFLEKEVNLSFDEKWAISQTFSYLISDNLKLFYKEALLGVSDLDKYIPSVKSYNELDRYLNDALGLTSFDLNIESSNHAVYSLARTPEGKVEITFSNEKLNESDLGKMFKRELENIAETVESANKIVGEIKTELSIKKELVDSIVAKDQKLREAVSSLTQIFDPSSLSSLMSVVNPKIDSTSLAFENTGSQSEGMSHHRSLFYMRTN